MKNKDKEKEILEFLKENGRSSTTKIAYATKSNTWLTRKYLDGLESEGKVFKEEETRATYWNLVEGNKNV